MTFSTWLCYCHLVHVSVLYRSFHQTCSYCIAIYIYGPWGLRWFTMLNHNYLLDWFSRSWTTNNYYYLFPFKYAFTKHLHLSDSESSEDEGYLKITPHLAHKKGCEDSILFEYEREGEIKVKVCIPYAFPFYFCNIGLCYACIVCAWKWLMTRSCSWCVFGWICNKL